MSSKFLVRVKLRDLLLGKSFLITVYFFMDRALQIISEFSHKESESVRPCQKIYLQFMPAPPEAPVTGYFLGKGAYFADTSTVSAQVTVS